MVLADGVSSSFKHLEGSDLIKTKIEGTFDTFITVDCADFKRTGKPFETLGPPDINIDHHVTNERFGKLNLIEGTEVATSAILTNYLPVWGYQDHETGGRGIAYRYHYGYTRFPHFQRHA